MTKKARPETGPQASIDPDRPSSGSVPPLSTVRNGEDFARAFGVPRETVDKLAVYATLLQAWQKAVNLVAPSTLDSIWHRHFADSAQILSHSPDARSWIDLGSGGGFPGLVIAILLANHENRVVHLIESNGRKCAFLSEVIRKTGAPARVHQGRIEDIVASGALGTADVVTSRALAPLATLLGTSSGFFGDNSTGLFLKGREARQEIAEAEKNWRFDYECIPSRTGGEGSIVIIRAPVKLAP
jgi:16S rRNA (guanine527-N7)-methyltransferase